MKKKLTLLSFEELAQEGRWITFLAAVMLSGAILDVSQAQNGLSAFERWYDWILFSLTVICWPILAIKRLRELRVSWAWFLPVGLCYAVEWIAALQGRNWVDLIAGGVAVLTQLPFIFLSPNKGAESAEPPLSGQPAP